MRVASFFSGAGGLDLGFKRAGFEVVFANEYDPSIWATYIFNNPETFLERRSITDIDDIPDVDGIIGGPPCQSWSTAGMRNGLEDVRGDLFVEYILLIKRKQPLFFIAENVEGLLSFKSSLSYLMSLMADSGYNTVCHLYNANNYGTPQNRKRLFFVGFRKDLCLTFTPPKPSNQGKTLRDAIWGMPQPLPSTKYALLPSMLPIPNHEYYDAPIRSSRSVRGNRTKKWDEPSLTIIASMDSRDAILHPSSPQMVKTATGQETMKGSEHLYRRLSIRESARIQTFPDDYVFKYNLLKDGYKMVGNAVPVELAKAIALQIKEQLGSAV